MQILTTALTSTALLLAHQTSAQANEAPAFHEAQIVGTTGQCPAGLKLETAVGDKITLNLGGLEAVADKDQPRSRALCVVKLALAAPPAGFQLQFAAPEISYHLEHGASGSANVSLRLFEPGTAGLAWFKRIADDAPSGDYAETPSDWQDKWHDCGHAQALHLLIDLSARIRPAENDRDASEAIHIDKVTLPALTYKRCAAAPKAQETEK